MLHKKPRQQEGLPHWLRPLLFVLCGCLLGYVARPFVATDSSSSKNAACKVQQRARPCRLPAFQVADGVYAVPDLLDAQHTCSAPFKQPSGGSTLQGTALNSIAHLQGLPYQIGPLEVIRPPTAEQAAALPQPNQTAVEASYLYQRRNLRNFILFLSNHIAGRIEWLDWCNNEHEGVNCFVEEEHGFMSDATPLVGNILDYGAGPDGAQLSLLKKCVVGQVVGFNIQHLFSAASFRHPQPNVSFVFGPAGKRLPFPDATFDFVVSMNVLEHVGDPALYLAEAVRVLKPGGLLYLNWVPSWGSPRGHHLHRDMVRRWAGELGCNVSAATNGFDYDGRTVPDWAHLLLDQEAFTEKLRGSVLGACEALPGRIAEYVYQEIDLNRVPYESIVVILKGLPGLSIEKVFADHFDEDTHLSAETFQAMRDRHPNITHMRLKEIVILARRA